MKSRFPFLPLFPESFLVLLGWILRSVFGSSFKRAAWNAVTQQPAQEEAPPSSDSENEPVEPVIDIVLCFENARVADAMLDRLQHKTETKAAGFTVVTGRVSNKHLAMAWPEPKTDSKQMCDALTTAYSPKLFISASFGTALHDSLSVGQVILANSVACKKKPRQANQVANQFQNQCTLGPAVSVNAMPDSPTARLELGKRSKAIVADRFSYSLVTACNQLKIPLLSIVAVTTTVNDQSTMLLKKTEKKEHVARRAGSLLGTVWQKPSSIADTWHAEEAAIKASSSIASFICDKIP